MYRDETAYKNALSAQLVEWGWDVQRHEDKYCRFIPDMSFAAHGADGWIEVKYLKVKAPKLFKIEHLTAGQLSWLETRARMGRSLCFVLVGTLAESILLPATRVRGLIGAPWPRAVALARGAGPDAESTARMLNELVRTTP